MAQLANCNAYGAIWGTGTSQSRVVRCHWREQHVFDLGCRSLAVQMARYLLPSDVHYSLHTLPNWQYKSNSNS